MNDQLTVHISDATVHIPSNIIEIWEQYRQISPKSKEACGILIGHQIQGTEVFQLEFVTSPQKQDIRNRSHFVMKDPAHQLFLNKVFRESKGTSIYLGTWHSHPQNIPIQSRIDERDWKHCIARNLDRNLFFIIVGIQEIRIYCFKKNSLNISSIMRF